jgi:hypothetical protein
VLSIARNGSAIGSITTLATATSYMTSASSGLLGVDATTIAFQTNSSERARIDSSGRLLIGTSTALVAGGSLTPAFQIAGGDQNSCTQMIRGAGSLQPSLAFTRSNGSIASPTTVTSGDGLGGILFEGYDGSNPIRAALITAAVDGTPGTNDMPGRLVFSTTADGASSPTERLQINSLGELTISSTRSGNQVSDSIIKFNILNSNGDSKKAEIKAIKTADVSSELIFSTTALEARSPLH